MSQYRGTRLGLPLVALLILAPPAYFPPARGAQVLAIEQEPVDSGERASAQRIRWARGRILEDDLGRIWASGCPLGLVRAVEWVDSLPLKVDVRGGAVTLTVRIHSP